MAFLNFVVRGIVNYEIEILMLPVMSYPLDNFQFRIRLHVQVNSRVYVPFLVHCTCKRAQWQ